MLAQSLQLPPLAVRTERLDETEIVRATPALATVADTQEAPARVDVEGH